MLKVSFYLENPYRPRDKCIAPLVAAGLAAGAGSALGSVASGVLGNKAIKDTNRKNLQIARETNQSNETINMRAIHSQEAMQAYQNRWNLEQWNRENEYNSPAAQVARLRSAGVNPYLDSNISAGEASSLQGSAASMPGQAAMQGATMNAPDMSWIGNAVTNGVNAYMQNQLLQTQIDKGAADAQISEANARTQSLRNAHEILKIANDASTSEYERDMAKSLLKVQEASEQNQIYHSDLMNKLSENQVYELQEKIAGQKILNNLNSIDAHYRARLNAAQLRSYQANVVQCYAAARAHDASSANSYAQKAVAEFTAAGLKIDNETKKSLNSAILDKAWTEAEQANDNRLFNILDKNFQYQGKVGNYFPMQSGQFSAADRYDDWYRKNRFRRFKKGR